MNKAMKKIFTLLIILTLLVLTLLNNVEVKQNIITATNLWATQVFPSLFPMFILSDLAIHYHLPEYLANLFGKFFVKIFHTSSYGIFALLMSLISGTPSSAFILKDLNNQGKITKEEANFLLSWTFFSNPLFLINILSLLFPDSYTIYKIILIHYSVNLLIGLLLRPKEKVVFTHLSILENKKDIGTILSNAIKKTMDTLIIILGTICFYYVIAHFFHTQNELINTFIQGFFELTQGLNQIKFLNSSNQIKEILAISFISFGGLSIHTQIQSIIKDSSLKYLPFLKGRLLHVLFSIFFILLF